MRTIKMDRTGEIFENTFKNYCVQGFYMRKKDIVAFMDAVLDAYLDPKSNLHQSGAANYHY